MPGQKITPDKEWKRRVQEQWNGRVGIHVRTATGNWWNDRLINVDGNLEKKNNETNYMEISDLANEMTFSTGNAKGTFLRNLTTNALTLPLAYPRFKNSEQNFFALALKSHLRLQMRPKHQSLEVTIPSLDRTERKQEGWGYFKYW